MGRRRRRSTGARAGQSRAAGTRQGRAYSPPCPPTETALFAS